MERAKNPEGRGNGPATRRKGLLGATAAAVALAVALAAAAAFALPTSEARASEAHPVDDAELADMPAQVAAPAPCEHFWAEETETVEHPAVVRDVVHDAVYRHSVERHTVCNGCNAAIDGFAAEHVAETGHGGFTTGVPVPETTLVSGRWTESVTEQGPWTEEVPTGRLRCMLCGEVRAALAAAGPQTGTQADSQAGTQVGTQASTQAAWNLG